MGKVGRPAGLTNRQREFAKYYVEGKYSNAECARKAGYAEAVPMCRLQNFSLARHSPGCRN